jgi:hypothetical protein
MNALMSLVFFVFGTAFASDVKLKDYQWLTTDIATKKLSKGTLFLDLDRDFIRTKDSICSNRAHMWAHDLKKKYKIDTAKVFLFYTKQRSGLSLRTWWYHVSPVVNEYGKLWALDAGFPGWISAPLTIRDWLFKFSDSYNCKEISASETDLVEFIFNGSVFPKTTAYGQFDCYYKIVPHTIWTPNGVAKSLLGKDEDGRPIQYERHEIDQDELYQACVEATTSKLDFAIGKNRKECKRYSGLPE